MLLDRSIELTPRPPFFWRLNESLLNDELTMADVHKELMHYFAANQTEAKSPMKVWEAHKPVVRGLFIKHGARLKKTRDLQIITLLTDIHSLETLHKQSQTP